MALVTGAARGIGAAVVRRLCASGHHVYALDACLGDDPGMPYPLASREDLARVAGEHPDRVSDVVADVREPEALRRTVARIVAEQGRLDRVVAAAAVIDGGAPLWQTDVAVLERLWAVDVLGVWHTAAASVPELLHRSPEDRPGFVAIASSAADSGLWHLAAYGMVKHAVAGLVRGLAADLRDTQVSVAGVSPGSTDTAMLAATARIYGLADASGLADRQRAGRLLTADEVAAVVELAATAGPVVHGSVLAAGGFVT
ncbi:MAG: mycofactocin-coupled SDR family oxidoreductase [Marmoricola sp.]